ncbi:MAG: NAD(P)(+) transhydrogenase (Re/Si-specific) subunit alpha, partial [Betaproteobacteria bacterium]|nr:NAD(P)(+) transhydrogenase (Re/Si-specific) subunit alpha [Betaproteobacteria bacterium]
MRIGIPKETFPGETRVAVTPETAKKLVGQGHSVIVEQSAGEKAHFLDAAYLAAGAELGDAKDAL